jgi:FkbM family methyltransferase
LFTKFQSYQEALIRSCYRVLLGREPEAAIRANERAPRLQQGREKAIFDILHRFVTSDEFRAIQQRGSGPVAPQGNWKLSLRDLVDGPRDVVEDRIMQRCLVSYLGDYTALCRILGRFVVFVDTRDVGFATHLMMRGIWEMGLTQFMVRTVKPGMRVADIGANFGYYSLLLSDLVTDAGYCFAFEPNPRAAGLLRQSLSVNGFDGRSSVMEIALSPESGDAANFYVPNAEPKNARFVDAVSDSLLEEGKLVRVRTRSFADMIPELGAIDFIKLDVEGAEFGILTGMLDFIRKSRPQLVAEINFARGYDPRDMLKELAALYGGIRYVHDDGYLYEVSVEQMSTEHVGSDWLVYFGRAEP